MLGALLNNKLAGMRKGVGFLKTRAAEAPEKQVTAAAESPITGDLICNRISMPTPGLVQESECRTEKDGEMDTGGGK